MSSQQSDEQAIANLLFRYAERIDRGDFEGVAELFAHGTYGSQGASVTGPGVAAQLSEMVKVYDDGTPKTQHVTTNLLIEIEPSRQSATCRSRFTVLQGLGGRPIEVIVAGRYHDRFDKVEGEWRFSERVMHVDLVGDLSAHLTVDIT